MRLPLALIWLGVVPIATQAADPPPVRFDRVVIDPDLADAYQVEVADVDGDGKPDIVALGNNTIAWYQNPTWTKRIIGATKSSPLVADIISSATTDLNGDGKAEVAIACDFAMNTPTRGQLFLASQGATIDDPWTFRKIKDVPSIHRIRWADLADDGKPELIVAPIFGPKAQPPTYDQDDARVVEFRPDPTNPKSGVWTERAIVEKPVVHAIEIRPVTLKPLGPGRIPKILSIANNTGVTGALAYPEEEGSTVRWKVEPAFQLPGAMGSPPKRGSSEVHLTTRFAAATIEPWHGSEVVVYREPEGILEYAEARKKNPAAPLPADIQTLMPQVREHGIDSMFVRAVIDNTLDEGHALWTADVDGDGSDEIFAGHRGKDHRVSMYRFDGKAWHRTVLDSAIAAQDLRGGDLDGDGVPDVVAVGGKTHNVVWYRPIRDKAGDSGPAR